ncbi:MAG: Uma2 family endonuclease [Symploca sp. SIO1A3]|nr:Uma2 family endonuclease [Symploca sp. SIO1A3]
MIIAKSPKPTTIDLPDHTQLPESDGTFVKNFQEHPQSVLLTDSIRPVLQQLHPDGQYRIGQDCGIYWRLTEPPEKGAEAPDWFYVPHIPPLLDGEMRRSYVLWKEYVAPLIVLEFVSGDGSEERDQTPPSVDNQGEKQKAGKFWVYEQAIRVPFYGIYEVKKASVDVYHLVAGSYELLSRNERGHYPIPAMGVELGIWQGEYDEVTLPWLRWWDNQGNLLLTGDERSQLLSSQLEQERQRAERLAERLRQMGIDPNEL